MRNCILFSPSRLFSRFSNVGHCRHYVKFVCSNVAYLDEKVTKILRAPIVQHNNRDSLQLRINGLGSSPRQSLYFISRKRYSEAKHSTLV